MAAVKKAADASGRKICFIGMSLGFYLEAAAREGRAPFDPKVRPSARPPALPARCVLSAPPSGLAARRRHDGATPGRHPGAALLCAAPAAGCCLSWPPFVRGPTFLGSASFDQLCAWRCRPASLAPTAAASPLPALQDVINASDLDQYDPNELLIVTTGSQARLLRRQRPPWSTRPAQLHGLVAGSLRPRSSQQGAATAGAVAHRRTAAWPPTCRRSRGPHCRWLRATLATCSSCSPPTSCSTRPRSSQATTRASCRWARRAGYGGRGGGPALLGPFLGPPACSATCSWVTPHAVLCQLQARCSPDCTAVPSASPATDDEPH